MTASTLPGRTPPATGAPFSRRALALAVTLALPAIVSLVTLRFLLPSPLAGASGGVAGVLSSIGDRYPLFAGLAIFVVLSEVGRYWLNQLAPTAAAPARPTLGTSKRSLVRILAVLAGAAVAAFVIRSSIVATYRIVGPSMLPTLEIGDRVLVNRLAYGVALPLSRTRLGRKLPQRGELVVFRAEGQIKNDGPQTLVKRVVGLPGDRIAFQGGYLVVNGWGAPSCDAGPYLALDGRNTVRGRLAVEFLGSSTYLTVRMPTDRPFAEYLVKPGEVFVMGDDRGMSSDSRAWSEGRGAGVPVDVLEGRVSRVLFGARPDHRLDFSRLLSPAFDLKVRMQGIDLQKTEQRINNCLAHRPPVTTPPPPFMSLSAGS